MRNDSGRSGNYGRDFDEGEDELDGRDTSGRFNESEYGQRPQMDRNREEFGPTSRPQGQRELPYRDESDGGSGTWRRGTMGRDVNQYRSDSNRGPQRGGFDGRQQADGFDNDRDVDKKRDMKQQDGSSRQSYDFGQHVGKGPKGYRRSDSRILEDVQEALARNGVVDATEMDVSVENGEVTLTGTVTSRQQKRDAEDCVEGVFGVSEVHNQLRMSKEENGAKTQSKSGRQASPYSSKQETESSRQKAGSQS